MLHVEERGAGPDVVLLHGAPTAPSHMVPLAERLAKSYRTLLVHLPGYGKSAPLQPYSLAVSHAQVEEALHARGCKSAHFIGFSGGAYRAIAIACRGTIVPRSIVSLAGLANVTEEEAKGFEQVVGMLKAGVDAAPILEELMLSPRGREKAAWASEVRSWATASSADNLAGEMAAFASAPDLRPALARLEVPMLVRVGSIDAASPPERSKRIVDVARNVLYIEVPGVGHALLCEDFEATAAAVERHLARLDAPPS